MDYKGTRYYNIPHFDDYYITNDGIIVSKKSLKSIAFHRFTKKSGYSVLLTNKDGVQKDVPIIKALIRTFYGKSKFKINTKVPIDKDMMFILDKHSIDYDNEIIESFIKTGYDKFDYEGMMYKQIIVNDNPIIINEDGLVYNIARHKFLLKIYGTEDEYPRVNIDNHAYLVHRLIAEAFLENWDPALFVNHKDGRKYNTYLSNLEMVTPQENIIHASQMNLIPGKAFNEEQIEEICKLMDKGKSMKYIMEYLPFLKDYSESSMKRLIYRLANTSQWEQITRKYHLEDYNDVGMQVIKKYSSDQIHEVCKMIEKGYSNKEIAKKLDVSRDSVQNIRAGKQWSNVSNEYNFNYKQQKQNYSKELIDEIYQLAKSGEYHTEKEIADLVGKDPIIIHRILYYDKFNELYNFNYKESVFYHDKNFMSDGEIHQVCQMIVDGKSNAYISSILNRSAQSISDIRQGKHCKDISSQYGIPLSGLYQSPNERLLDPKIRNAILNELRINPDRSNREICNSVIEQYSEYADEIVPFRVRNLRQSSDFINSTYELSKPCELRGRAC